MNMYHLVIMFRKIKSEILVQVIKPTGAYRSVHILELNIVLQGPLLLTWINFNPSMEK